ncbi:hypothetical protein C4566_03165 [Candidatus Parcubacteria bacterium]|nr:MAG: hypothetical protein C4566_03165 [Candidatus Parcubacteria bacterium]
MADVSDIDKYLNDYSQTEQSYYNKVRDWRDGIFLPVARFFNRIGVSANQLSFFGLLVLAGFVYYIVDRPYLASIFLLLHLLLDGIDGTVARVNKKDDMSGAVVDTVVDHTGIFIVVLSLGFFGLIDSNIGLVYIYFYTVMVFLVIVRYLLKIPVRLVVRSKALVYGFYILWAFTGINYLNVALLIFSILLIWVTLVSFFKVKDRLKGKRGGIKDF